MLPIKTIYALLETKWPWTPESYPILARLTNPKDILAFQAHHALGHLHKTTGKIEAALEKVDHGAGLDRICTKETQELVGKCLVDLFQVAHVLGIDARELEEKIEHLLHTPS